MGTNGNFSRQKIQPIIDVPLVLQLETINGEECTSKYNGVEYRYYVTLDGSPAIIYLNESGRDAILDLRPQPGDYVELLKQKHRGEFVYSAQLLSDAQDEPEPPNRTPRMLAPASQPRPNSPRRPAPPSHPATRRQDASRAANRDPGQPYSYGDLMRQPVSQAPPPRAEANDVSAGAKQLAGCLRISFDAWEELKTYAHSKGVTLDYTSEDVRATALTWFIQHSKGVR